MNALRSISTLALGLAALFATFSHADAGTHVFDPTTGTCTGLNCSSESVSGTFGSLGAAADSLPWTIQIYAVAERCLRVELTDEVVDLEAVLVTPNGNSFRNDDGGGAGCPLCPLIKLANTPVRGWYTLQISHYAGRAEFSNFTLRYGLYASGNPNCANPTAAQSVRARTKPAGVEPADAFGQGFDLDAPGNE